MKFFYHYTLTKYIEKIKQTGIYPNHPYFTSTEYYNSFIAGQALGVMSHNIDCVLKFKDDGRFKKMGNVPSTNRFTGGGNQYSYPGRPKPIEVRKINHRNWKRL